MNYTECQVKVEEKHRFQNPLVFPGAHSGQIAILFFIFPYERLNRAVQEMICEFISKLVKIRLLMYLSMYVSPKLYATSDVGERVDMWFGWYT